MRQPPEKDANGFANSSTAKPSPPSATFTRVCELSGRMVNVAPAPRSSAPRESTGAVCPLYSYTDVYLCSDELAGMYLGPNGTKYFRGVSTHEGNDAYLASLPQESAAPAP